MRIHALLSWYEEPYSCLAATVSSLKGLCDSVIAVDGAYALFPGSLHRPNSGPEQANVIASVCHSLRMDVTIHQRGEPWWKNEAEKRGFMFTLGETVSEPEDWYFLIDADETVSGIPGDARERLEASDLLAAECQMWEKDYLHVLPDGTQVGALGVHPIRRFWRALRGIEVGPAHHQFHVGDIWLSDAGRPYLLGEALAMHDLKMEHHNVFRSDERLALKARYYAHRESLGIEREEEAHA